MLRPFLLLALMVAAMAGLVACGGGDDGGGGSGGGGTAVSDNTDVSDVLTKAFDTTGKITKGVAYISAKGEVGGQSGEFTMSGPFESQGKAKLPKFDWDISVNGGGQNIKAGIENTGSKAFVNYNGTEYVVDDATYKQFVQGYEQAAGQSEQQGAGSLKELGIDPASWLKDPENEGDSDVEGTETVKVGGDVDVPKMLADVNTIIQKAGSLGLSGQANLPDQLTDAQIKQAEEAIQDLSIEVDAAKSDGSLRRMVVDVDAKDPNSSEEGEGTLEIRFSKVGEAQEFPEPSGAKPIQELLGQFGGLGGLGGAAGGSGASSGSAGGSSASQDKLEDYSKCIEAAGSDTAAAQKCAEKLG